MTTREVTIAGFAAAIAVLVTLELLARRKTSSIPRLGEWLGYVMRPKAGRALILLGWLWLGWHYFARLGGARAGPLPRARPRAPHPSPPAARGASDSPDSRAQRRYR